MGNARRLITGLFVGLAALALAGGPALAQDAAVIPEQDERQTLTDDLIGMPVYIRNAQTDARERIGSIQSLLLNEDSRLAGVVVSIGGVLGFGAKSVAMDWAAVELEQFGETGFVANVAMTREQLEEAPEFRTLTQVKAEEAIERERQQIEQQQDETGTDAQ